MMSEAVTSFSGEVVREFAPDTLAAALARFQSELPTIAKLKRGEIATKGGGSYSYDYAGLEDISPIVLPLLGKQGLSWSCSPTMEGDHFTLQYSLSHPGGEAIVGSYPLPDPATNTPQQIGSAITYARRYSLCSVTGVAPGGDDDDAAVANSAPASKPRAKKPASPPQQPVGGPKVASKDWPKLAMECTDLPTLKALCEEASKSGELGLPVNEGEPPVGDFLTKLWQSRSLEWAKPTPEPSDWDQPKTEDGAEPDAAALDIPAVLDDSIGGEK
jgi:hypothetical protein